MDRYDEGFSTRSGGLGSHGRTAQGYRPFSRCDSTGAPPELAGRTAWGGSRRHNVADQTRHSLLRMMTGTSALPGRLNYQGFGWYWPAVAQDESADPATARSPRWLDEVEKVVFSTTLSDVSWHNSRLVEAGPGDTVRALRSEGAGDIWVLSSQSIIRSCWRRRTGPPGYQPGTRTDRRWGQAFRGWLPAWSWVLAASVPSDSVAIRLDYGRKR